MVRGFDPRVNWVDYKTEYFLRRSFLRMRRNERSGASVKTKSGSGERQAVI